MDMYTAAGHQTAANGLSGRFKRQSSTFYRQVHQGIGRERTYTISTVKYTILNYNIFLRGIISRWHFSHVPHINRVLSTARCIYYNTRTKT